MKVNAPTMLVDRELKISMLSRSRSTSSMFQTVDSSPRNEPKAKPQGHPLSYIPRHLLSGETAQHGHSSRLRSHSSPSAPLRQAPGCQSERSETASSRIAGTHPLTMGHETLPGAKRRLEINTKDLTRPSLAASQDQLLPESPGFPNMLAAMNFPIPPTTSRPSTADACVGSMARYQSSITSPPMVRPRSSSKRATSSNGVLTASLDGLIIQRTALPHRRSDPGEISHVSSKPDRLVINTTVTRSSRSATLGETGRSLAMGRLRPRASSAASSTRVGHDSHTVAANEDGRQFLRNNIKAVSSLPHGLLSTNEPYNLPIGIAISSPRDLMPNVDKPFSTSERAISQHPTHTVPTISLTLPSPYEEKDPDKRNLTPKCFQQGSNKTVPSKPTSTSTCYDATIFDSTIPPIRNADNSKDSPILGRFLGNSPTTPRLPSRSPSRTREDQSVSKESGVAQTTPIGTMESDLPPLATVIPENNWNLSRIMTTEIAPANDLIIPMTTNDITITPVMVVANLNPQSAPAASVPFSRPPFNKLKIISQPRQKHMPIMVHKSVITGHNEHAKLAIDKFNRHTLTGVLTPPTSPSSASPKRNSHPTEITRRIQSRVAGKPMLKSEAAIYHEPDQEKVNDKAWRVTRTKERLEKAKLAREEEISRLVEKMLGVAKAKDTEEREDPQSLHEEHTEEQIEKRLQRLEEDGDACLRDVKLALQNMSKTLDELRKEKGSKRLIMNEFNL
ncbi:hypothetical protein F5Y00DRAFT_246163 [Daldinia vernicosa]|uniref:uncharacterized protein n=1 Tax=Daldinia vernicosa TaxID=114800 RepID=UPI002007D7BD|nr:uncharacterized protein F5Y00DRAFT_246163 [Daldinia vernicosa]KAI0845561.1 hypothetical protein F5Y00DRAFT_246163 [Daldinia vernicosa]